MMKISKNCCVRLPDKLHRIAKLHAYSIGMTLQDFLIEILKKELQDKFSKEL